MQIGLQLENKEERINMMSANVNVGIIGSKELAEIQNKIDAMPPGEYRLRDIVGDTDWTTVRRKRLLGKVISKEMQMGNFRNARNINKKKAGSKLYEIK